MVFVKRIIRTRLKNRILVQDRGGAEFKPSGILLYVEDLKRGPNKDIGPKDIFEMGSNKVYRSGLFPNTGPKSCAASLSTVLVFKPSIDLDQTVEGGVKINGIAKNRLKHFCPGIWK